MSIRSIYEGLRADVVVPLEFHRNDIYWKFLLLMQEGQANTGRRECLKCGAYSVTKSVVTVDTPMLMLSSIVEVTLHERNDVIGAFTGHCDGERAQALREIGRFLEAYGFHGQRQIKSTARLMKLLEKQEYFAKSEGHLVELVQTYLKSDHGVDFGTYMLP